jgi:hypothetical protein
MMLPLTTTNHKAAVSLSIGCTLLKDLASNKL